VLTVMDQRADHMKGRRFSATQLGAKTQTQKKETGHRQEKESLMAATWHHNQKGGKPVTSGIADCSTSGRVIFTRGKDLCLEIEPQEGTASWSASQAGGSISLVGRARNRCWQSFSDLDHVTSSEKGETDAEEGGRADSTSNEQTRKSGPYSRYAISEDQNTADLKKERGEETKMCGGWGGERPNGMQRSVADRISAGRVRGGRPE